MHWGRGFFGLAALAFFGFASPAQASLIGDTVTCAQTGTGIFSCNQPSAVVVDPGIEFIVTVIGVDIGANTITYTNNLGSEFFTGSTEVLLGSLEWFPALVGEIIGFELTTAVGVTNVDVSDFDVLAHSVNARFDDGNTWSPDAQIVLTLQTSHDVPEPGSLALLGVGLAGLVLARRRRSGDTSAQA